jgi:dCTP deaminase
MSFWSSQTLEARLAELVPSATKDQVDCNAVTLTVGSEIYVTPELGAPAPNRHTLTRLAPGEAFTIPPGQFAFLLTEESVAIPPAAMGFLSMKASYKLRGLVNVSGFHVDPGWKGQLIFSLFNVGPAPVHLKQGLPLFLIWYADLDAESEKRKTTISPGGIPPNMINNVTGVLDSMSSLDKRLKDEAKRQDGEREKLSERIHAVEKFQFKVVVITGIAGVVFAALIGVALKNLWDRVVLGKPVPHLTAMVQLGDDLLSRPLTQRVNLTPLS